MGTSSRSVTLVRCDRGGVAAFWRSAGWRAYVVEGEAGQVVVFDEADRSGEEGMTAVVVGASAALATVVIAAEVIDSDVLSFVVASGGVVVDRYCSCPGYFDEEGSFEPSGGDAQALAELFAAPTHSTDPVVIEEILDDVEYVFADDRQRELFNALGLPRFATSSTFERLAWASDPAGELGVSPSAVVASFDRP